MTAHTHLEDNACNGGPRFDWGGKFHTSFLQHFIPAGKFLIVHSVCSLPETVSMNGVPISQLWLTSCTSQRRNLPEGPQLQ